MSLARSIKRIQSAASVINNVRRPRVCTRKWWSGEWRWAAPLLASGVVMLIGVNLGYHRWKHGRIATEAGAALKRGDLHEASARAFALLEADPRDLVACKTLAALADACRPADALAWHRQVLKLDPEDVENRWATVRAALLSEELWTARQLLAQAPPPLRKTAEYHRLLGVILIREERFAEAATHLEKARALDPSSSRIQFDLARARVLRSEPEQEEQARSRLEEFSRRPEFRLEALRTLSEAAVRHGQPQRALRFAMLEEREPGISFEDSVQALALLHLANAASFLQALESCEARNAAQPQSAANLLLWMNETGLPLLALDWALRLPAEVQKDPRVLFAVSNSHFALSDWNALETLVSRGQWELYEPLRLALLAFCERRIGGQHLWKKHLDEAFLKSRGEPQVSALLYRMISRWGTPWRDDLDEFAWRALDQPGPPQELVRALQERFSAAGDTHNLYRLIQKLFVADPSNLAVRNDFVACSLLLKENVEEARSIALDSHQADERDPRRALTYAFSLFTQDRPAKAVQILELYPDARDDPSFAVYLGIFLAAADQTAPLAEQLLEAAPQASLLPEESALVNEAEAHLQSVEATRWANERM